MRQGVGFAALGKVKASGHRGSWRFRLSKVFVEGFGFETDGPSLMLKRLEYAHRVASAHNQYKLAQGSGFRV